MQVLEDYVNRLGEAGIYSILDCHQDLLSPKFCGETVRVWCACGVCVRVCVCACVCVCVCVCVLQVKECRIMQRCT